MPALKLITSSCRVLLVTSVFFTGVLWWLADEPLTCPIQPTLEDNFDPRKRNEAVPSSEAPLELSELPCRINGEYSVPCRKQGPEVYVPFSFLSKYFEVYGQLQNIKSSDGQGEVFDWQHSYSRVYEPRTKHSASGTFMSFEHYNVEFRDRVKCISGVEEVPVSTQWGAHGYFYPIQIAQYGLSHLSKYLVNKTQRISMLETAESTDTKKWTVIPGARVLPVWNEEAQSQVISFSTPTLPSSSTEKGVCLQAKSSMTFLSFDVKFSANSSSEVLVIVQAKTGQNFYLHYLCGERSPLIFTEGSSHIYHTIGDRTSWSKVTRDLSTDLHKGVNMLFSQHPPRSNGAKTRAKEQNDSSGVPRRRKIRLGRVVSICFKGMGAVDNVTLSSQAHLSQFYAAANWLLRNQDNRGGWPIDVQRVLAEGRLQLAPGWYSAMAQGQAISTLVRAYNRTQNRSYLEAALRATALFEVPATQGGVLASFAGQYDWYEEYPTTPSCFVLNGFMYALIALYDLQQTLLNDKHEQATTAARLYSAGMRSLKAMLPLFDTGSGSIYDLRHFSLGASMAPNLARWDYHTTHINQLLLLATVDTDPVLKDTATRWSLYMRGYRAPHN